MESSQQPGTDRRHHVRSLLMRESLLDKQVMSSTETPVVRMLPDCHVIKVGGRSIIDGGKRACYPLVEAIGGRAGREQAHHRHRRRRPQPARLSIGIDLGLPTGVLAQLALADALGNAHMLGTLLAPYGVVAHPAGDLRPPPAAFHAGCARGHLQRRSALLLVGASARASAASRRTAPMPAPISWRSASAARR